MVRSRDLGVRLPGFESLLCHLLTVEFNLFVPQCPYQENGG